MLPFVLSHVMHAVLDATGRESRRGKGTTEKSFACFLCPTGLWFVWLGLCLFCLSQPSKQQRVAVGKLPQNTLGRLAFYIITEIILCVALLHVRCPAVERPPLFFLRCFVGSFCWVDLSSRRARVAEDGVAKRLAVALPMVA